MYVSIALFITEDKSEKFMSPSVLMQKVELQKGNRKLEFDSWPVRGRQAGSCDLKLEQVRTL